MEKKATIIRMNLTIAQQEAIAPLLNELDAGQGGGAVLIHATRFNMTARLITADQCQQINQHLTGHLCDRIPPTLRITDRSHAPQNKLKPAPAGAAKATEQPAFATVV